MSEPTKPTPPPIELSDADQRALDALLTEALRPGRAQRDFTTAVLARARQQTLRLPDEEFSPPPEPRYRSNWVVAAAAAALAASALLVLLPQQLPHEVGPLAQDGTGATPTDPAANADRPSTDAGDAATPGGSVSPERPPRKPPVELSLGVTTPEPPPAEPAIADLGPPAEPPPVASHRPPSDTADLEDFNRQFAAYWQAIGVTPAPAIDQDAWAARIADRFGWQPSPAESQPLVEHAFTDRQACEQLAQRLVDQLLVGLKPSGERRKQLVQEATDVILSGGRFDRWVSTWITDDAWLEDVSKDRKQDPARVGEWLASRVIGADVGCARCHDSPLDSRMVQHDFWAMAAVFAPEDQPLFYELQDGRQRIASPGVPSRWFDVETGTGAQLASPEELDDLIEGSPKIARTLANHLWTIGFGMPLVAASSSPMAPPRDDALERALAMLGDQLVSNGFDIRAAARWVIACDPMKRDVPEQMAGERWQLADEAALAEASLAQRAFAASRITMRQASRNQLLALLQSRSGLIPATLAAPDSLLAQPRPRSPQPPSTSDGPRRAALADAKRDATQAKESELKESDLKEYWWTQWLADREALADGWLDSIEDSDQQLRHAFYAAGYRHVSPEQLQKVQALLDATQSSQTDRDETIAQIHWILQNSR